MKAIWRRYLNEIIGLTVMALMTVALIAAQVQAGPGASVHDESRPILEIHLTLSEQR